MQQLEPLTDSQSAHVASLVVQFWRGMERRQRTDEEWIATFERVARDERIREAIKRICKETST
jgi:hypothetical protein